MLRFLRIISIIIISTIACIGLTKEYFSTGQLNKFDLYALIATGIFLLVSILTEYFQFKDDSKKENKTEERFKNIHLSINKPLFPFSIIYCLKFRGNKEIIKEYFQHHIDFYTSLKKMSPPNIMNYTPALTDFPFDEDKKNADIVVGKLTESELIKAINSSGRLGSDGVYLPLQTLKIEIFKANKNKIYPDKPDLILNTRQDTTSRGNQQKIFDIRLYNDKIYQACIIEDFVIEFNNNKILNVSELAGCKWNVSLEFRVFDKIHYEIEPKLSHLELRLGKAPKSTIELTQETLDTGLITRNKNGDFTAHGIIKDFSILSLDYTFEFPFENFDDCVRQKN